MYELFLSHPDEGKPKIATVILIYVYFWTAYIAFVNRVAGLASRILSQNMDSIAASANARNALQIPLYRKSYLIDLSSNKHMQCIISSRGLATILFKCQKMHIEVLIVTVFLVQCFRLYGKSI
jgi:hypothetical protein